MSILGSKLDILKPEWLEIVFNDRNKAYGAYELRKQNPKSTVKALVITLVFFIVAVSAPTIINKIKGFIPKAKEKVKIVEVVLPPPPPDAAKNHLRHHPNHQNQRLTRCVFHLR
jgi:protein TonB